MGAHRTPTMNDETKPIALGIGVVVALLLALGLTVQDWRGTANPLAMPQFPWGTFLTVCLLSAEATAIAVMVPEDGHLHLKIPFRAAYGLEGVGWATGALLLQRVVPVPHLLQEPLTVFATAAIGLAGIWRVYVAVVAGENAGHLRSLPERRVLAHMTIAVSVIFLILLGLNLAIPMPEVIMALFKKVLMCLLLVLVGIGADEKPWAAVVALFFTVAIVLEYWNPMPFRTCALFHTSALVNTILMLYLISTFCLITAIVDEQTYLSKVQNSGSDFLKQVDDKLPMHTNKDNRNCCDCSGRGDKWFH